MQAIASHKSTDADIKEVQRRFHAAASRPDGPAAPSILSTVLRISCPSIASNRTEWGSIGGVSDSLMDDCCGGCFGGCFWIYVVIRISITVQSKWTTIVVLSNQSKSSTHFTFHHPFSKHWKNIAISWLYECTGEHQKM